MRHYFSAILVCSGVCLTLAAAAQAPAKPPGGYPDRPVRMLVPFVAGGGTDLVARGVAQKLTDRIGQQVVVDNRPGAGGRIAMETTKSAAADGSAAAVPSSAKRMLPPSKNAAGSDVYVLSVGLHGVSGLP